MVVSCAAVSVADSAPRCIESLPAALNTARHWVSHWYFSCQHEQRFFGHARSAQSRSFCASSAPLRISSPSGSSPLRSLVRVSCSRAILSDDCRSYSLDCFRNAIIWIGMDPISMNMLMKNVAGFHSFDFFPLPCLRLSFRKGFGIKDFQKAGSATLRGPVLEKRMPPRGEMDARVPVHTGLAQSAESASRRVFMFDDSNLTGGVVDRFRFVSWMDFANFDASRTVRKSGLPSYNEKIGAQGEKARLLVIPWPADGCPGQRSAFRPTQTVPSSTASQHQILTNRSGLFCTCSTSSPSSAYRIAYCLF